MVAETRWGQNRRLYGVGEPDEDQQAEQPEPA